MLAAAKLWGISPSGSGQPAVLGELLAGVLLGRSLLGRRPHRGARREHVHILAELGVAAAPVRDRAGNRPQGDVRVGRAVVSVAAGRASSCRSPRLPLLAHVPHAADGLERARATAAIFIGAALTATSVGHHGRVLTDLGRMARRGVADHHRRRRHRRCAGPGHPDGGVGHRRRARPCRCLGVAPHPGGGASASWPSPS